MRRFRRDITPGYDRLAAATYELAAQLWAENVADPKVLPLLKELVERRMGKAVKDIPDKILNGGFHVCIPMMLAGGSRVLLRIAYPGSSGLEEEKAAAEVATLRFLKEKTTIPVPKVFHWGTKEQCPRGFGPFMIMEYVRHSQHLALALQKVDRVLDKDDPENRPEALRALAHMYEQVADIVLQLSRCEFPRIGTIAEVAPGRWDVVARPLTFNMNELVELAHLDGAELPAGPRDNAHEYFLELAQTHADHLEVQTSGLFVTAAEGAKLYASRQMLLDAARARAVARPEDARGPFPLWCDDLRGMNILLDERHDVVAVIDLEFAYAAPREYAASAPWWLMAERPERARDLGSWAERFGRRVTFFLAALERAEAAAAAAAGPRRRGRWRFWRAEEDGGRGGDGGDGGDGHDDHRLSRAMRAGWETGDFWLWYALRHSWGVDGVFWAFLTERCGGFARTEDEAALQARIRDRLSPEQRAGLVRFVEEKMRQEEAMRETWALLL